MPKTALQKLQQFILSKVGKAINQYGMIEDKDKVLVAVSGGKDSVILLEALALRRKSIPIHYDLIAVHIEVDNVPYSIDRVFLENMCKALDVPLHYHSIHLDVENNEKAPCFICSWNRRKALFQLTKEYNCNKLAFGHHMDDALETLLMNMTTHGNISSIPPKLSMFKGTFEAIRPLILLQESELILYKELRHIPDEKATCPFETTNQREEYKKLLTDMERINPNARKNLFRSMRHIDKEYLP